MAQYSKISPDLAKFLHEERGRILSFVGAGVSVGAGVPATADLAKLIAQQSREEGARIARSASFSAVCGAVSDQLGHLRLQQITAEVIDRLEIRPTPLEQLIVRAPLRVVVTTNFDASLRLAAEEAGLTPLIRTPSQASALDTPGEDQVVIVHLHGHTGEPSGMALPGESMDTLANNEAFTTVLRGLVIARTVMYLGYRLPEDDQYLRLEIESLAKMFADRGPHRVLLPEKELLTRVAELGPLMQFGLSVDTFDSEMGYQAVEQAALLIAPGNTVEGHDELAQVRDTAPYYLAPSLLAEDRTRNPDEPDSRLVMARMGFASDGVIEPKDVLTATRVLVIGEPGMGKTQLLHHLGAIEDRRVPLIVKLGVLAGELQPGDDIERVLAATLAQARAFGDNVAPPTREALDGNAYLLLFDALDEVPADRRDDVVEILQAFAERYPHQIFVVTSRVSDDVLALEAHGFSTFRIPRDDNWGRRYLQHRGISDARVEELLQDVQTLPDLLAVPQYASLIGERLASEPLEPIPATGFELMIDVGIKDAVRREADLRGYSADELFHWLQLLAVSLELRGRLTASVQEFADIPGPNELRSAEARERLVERALLQDVPGIAALPTNAVQEALAADALLHTNAPFETFKEAATTTLAGRVVFRADLDHMIDLFFEGADADLRLGLRALDELRWARTTRADAPDEELKAALDALWDIYVARRVWLDTNPGREVRDARSAITRLLRSIQDVGGARRARWLEATRSDEPTTRANAAFFLRELGLDAETPAWLERLLGDPNSVVRRQAASAARSFEEAGAVFLPALQRAYRAESDELAAEAIGFAIYELSPAGERVEAIKLLIERPLGWNRISYLVGDLPLEQALEVFDQTGVRNDTDERMLSEVAAKTPAADWTDDQVRTLVRVLLRSQRMYYREFRERELFEELAQAHSQAAIAGAREGASDEVNWNDLSFLQRVDRRELEAAASGDLEGPLRALLEILDLREAPPVEPKLAQVEARPQPPTLLESLQSETFESRARARIPRPLLESYTRQTDDLPEDAREQLAEIVARLWPDGALSDAVTIEGNTGQAPPGLEVALAMSAALDLPLDSERWLNIFESGAVFFWWPATAWLKRHSDEVDQVRVVDRFGSLETEFQVRQALECLSVVSEDVAEAAATALIRINAVDSIFMLREFRERGQLQPLRRIRDEARAPEIRRAAQRELAESGDVDAQRRELQQMREDVEANPNAYRIDGISWASAASPEAIDELGALLRQVAEIGGDERGLERSIQTALAATRDERALELYDEIIEDPNVQGRSFYRYQRDQLARDLARDRALERLPQTLPEVAHWILDRGFEII